MAAPEPEPNSDRPAAESPTDRSGDPEGGAERLGIDSLLALQLAAHGYSATYIAQLRHRGTAGASGVARDLQRALATLGVGTLREAIVEARRRGLID
jgi:hypothetical protein